VVLFTPPGGRPSVDETVYTGLDLGPRVVSLLKGLPYWISSEFVEWAQIRPDPYLPNYRGPHRLWLGRRVRGFPDGNAINPDAGQVGDSEEVMLIAADTISRHDHGELVFSHIRQAFPDYVPEVPEEANYYRNRVTSGCMRPRSLGIM
jgi:hypothetical protein